MEYIHVIKSPIGLLTVSSDGKNVSGLWIEGQKYFAKTLEKDFQKQNLPIFENVKKWLDIYFSGEEPNFRLSFILKGSQFQKAVWNILCKIPYGRTTTYGEIAEQFNFQSKDSHTSARAVGNAVGHNPISIIIPCHRVIGKNNSLVGYAGGINIKRNLLQMEGVEIKKS